ncbi:MAG: FIST signal transduction protein [Mariniblastus sp.]
MSNDSATQFAQAHSIGNDLSAALAKTATQLSNTFDHNIHLLFAFVAGFSPDEFDQVMPSLKELTGAENVVGCSCEATISGGLELENEKSISLWAACLPESDITPLHLEFTRSGSESAITGWPDKISADWPEDSCLIGLNEPFQFPVDYLLERFNEDRPGLPIIGGIASGSQEPGVSRLLLNDQSFDSGWVGVRLANTAVRTLVSQGCRPIGKPMVITQAERNILQQIGGRPALEVLSELFQTLPTREQRIFQSGLQIGRVINEYQDSFQYGDFLIRNIVGVDEELGAISVGDYVRPGQTIQFHIRDHESASAELTQLLQKQANQGHPKAALLFTCNGRGLNLFEDPNHDAACIQSMASMPLAGFFAAGEVGPVGNNNFLHGFTASVVLFD